MDSIEDFFITHKKSKTLIPFKGDGKQEVYEREKGD
jgi:hypothetical protein